MMKENRPVFSGRWNDCLAHYAQTFNPKVRLSVRAEELRLFCGTHSRTVEGWLTGKGKPAGENIAKMWCFLQAKGYSVLEIEALAPVRRILLQLVGFGVITARQLSKELDYRDDKGVYRIIYGLSGAGSKPQPGRIAAAEEIVKRYENALREKKEQSKIQPLQRAVVSELATSPLAGIAEEKFSTPNGRALELQTLGNLIRTILLLTRHVLSDDFTPAQREQLRKIVGNNDVYHLANDLNALCSETARRKFREPMAATSNKERSS